MDSDPLNGGLILWTAALERRFFVTCHEPLEGVDFFDVLLDTIGLMIFRNPISWISAPIRLFFILYFSNDSCSRSTCRHVDPSKTYEFVISFPFF